MSDPVASTQPDELLHEAAAPVLLPAVVKVSAVAGTGMVEATPLPKSEREDMSVFFGIGIIVNLTLFTLLIIWGIGQWKKSDDRKK